MRLLKVETCNLNQRAMDFDCNLENIKDSISKAKEAGAIIRLGPKLEVANFRGSVSRFQEQASGKAEVPSITAPYSLCQSFDLQIPLSIPLKISVRNSQVLQLGIFLVSSEATRSRAKLLANEIGSWHLDVSIDGVISALLTLFEMLTGKRLCNKVDGGSNMENLGLQNIHARIRMVLAFMLASLLPRVHNKSGFYLVSGSSNMDEGLRGYMTKIGICTGNYFSRHAAMVILVKAG
ncbi:hypothetical protein SAY86_022284 [Trapa natans]|uniref:NAD/GMP synthase domain-containing protein n=1 Tax=Trapa natans TaxID=22666 RepID=A0AAN7RFD5_TRANT|nr:hypothetical protein SAY86_022284 [Trapa natans]